MVGSSKSKKQIGKIHDKSVLFFRQHVGEATSDDIGYEMSVNVGGLTPIVLSKKTGKWFTLGWEDIINLAVVAGINQEG